MRTITVCVLLLSLVPSVLAQEVHRVSASGEVSPQLLSVSRHADTLVDQGEESLKSGYYQAAEQIFREASAVQLTGIPQFNPSAERGLAEALTAQGKITEAIQLYRMLIYQYPRNLSSVAQEVRTLMRYAIVLSQMGQWPEAVSVYEKALPGTLFHGMPNLDVHFDPQIPVPAQLQAIAHVACGIEFIKHGDNLRAFKEYEKGSYLTPDSALVNYYYGDGWQQLSPAEQTKFGSEQQAKAALQKAVKIGKGPVKKAAQKALRTAMKTK